MPDDDKRYPIRRPWTALVAGASVGTLGGLIGLGGAEFRLPILITAFDLCPHRAVRFNLLVSLITLLIAAVARLGLASTSAINLDIPVLVAMISGGCLAAWIGAGALARVPATQLMKIIAALLGLVGLLLLAEALYPTATPEPMLSGTLSRVVGACLAGLVIGAISSLLGVAGGEFIIPTLIFVFAMDVKAAGTSSLLISLPIVAVGVIRHRLTGHYRSPEVLRNLVLPMSVGSAAGAVLGAILSAAAPVAALKILLGTILATSAIKLFAKSGTATAKPPPGKPPPSDS